MNVFIKEDEPQGTHNIAFSVDFYKNKHTHE